jgi:signal transduction histidine kinase
MEMKAKGRLFPDFPFHTVESLRVRIGWYINLRWVAVFVLLITIPLGKLLFKFELGFDQLTFIAALLVTLNILSFFVCRYLPLKGERQELIFAEILILLDLIMLSFLIHFSGGIENPFFFLYLVQVIYSAILFPGSILPYSNALIAALLMTGWTILEYTGAVHHYNLGAEQISISIVVTGLAAFYLTNFAGIYIINSFMFRYRELKRKIDEKNRLLEESIEQRNRLFRFTAHEIKAPITTVQSTLSVIKRLSRDNMEAQSYDMLLRAEKRTEQVLDMVKEMIEITKYNLSIEKPKPEPVEFGDFICKTVSPFRSYGYSKNIDIKIRLPGHPVHVEIDRSGMEKVISNLVMNAIRYTPPAGKVEVKLIHDNSHFGFSVIDSGIGIRKEELPMIFEEFYRTKEARDMEQIGTGLGLNLVRGIVRQQGGTIEVKSEIGKGSRFTVRLPFEDDNQGS